MFKISEYSVINSNTGVDGEVIDYGVNLLGAPLEWNETMGRGISVGVIDTGVDFTHVDLKDRVAEYINFTTEHGLDDLSGHGTHVSGILAASLNGVGVVGVAPEAELYVAKAFKQDGSGDDKAIADSLEWLIKKDVKVINMSFASETPSDVIYSKIKKANEKGIILVAAAGNDANTKDSIGYPAKWKEVIAVTAVDFDKKFASFSSVGKEAQIAAAGKEIYSTLPDNSYGVLSGTSMAAPLISGASALLQSKAKKRFNRFLTPEEMRTILCIYADDFGENGWDEKYGYGVFSFGRIK